MPSSATSQTEQRKRDSGRDTRYTAGDHKYVSRLRQKASRNKALPDILPNQGVSDILSASIYVYDQGLVVAMVYAAPDGLTCEVRLLMIHKHVPLRSVVGVSCRVRQRRSEQPFSSGS